MQNLQYSRGANRFWWWGVGGPEGHKHNPHVCDNMHPQYPIIMLDLLYVVYAEIRYVVYEYRAVDRGAWLVVNAY